MTESMLLAAPQPGTQRPLQITLLGPPQLTWANQPVPLPRRQLRALLYRLVVALQPVPREQLCFLLWPDIPEATARRNLTVLLTQLRQALPAPDIVRTQGDAVLLDPAYIQADTLTFAEASTLAARRGELEPLAGAVQLYAGPFLHGFSLPASAEFDAWVAQERQHWEHRYLDALATLVDGYATSGAYPQAIAAAQRALAVDELAEDMHRNLIALYAAMGDRTAALRQFERCVTALERELGICPLPETRAVYDAVRVGELPLRRSAGDTLRATHLLAQAAPSEARAPSEAAQATSGRVKLPAPSAPLIGRQTELVATAALLTDPAVRLLTLVGTGGSGKTRLALQVAWDMAGRFADGAAFVALAPLHDPALVLQTIGHTCGIAQSGPAALAEYLRDKQLLLVLDNCEHVLAAGPESAALLAAAPGLRVLATSRAALNLHGEQTFPVPPLPLPDLAHLPPLAELAEVPSMALLLARTRALNPRFQLTAEKAADLVAICVRLDGLPLAIELAAARLKLLTPRDLLCRLDRRLTLLTSGSRDLPERQQTLRATIDWSYRLLDTAEQIWFERCSVFAGGWTLATLEALDERMRWRAAAHGPDQAAEAHLLDVLTALVEKSLVRAHVADDGETRFDMLETIREFAAERLRERGTWPAVANAHADTYAAFLERGNRDTPEWLAAVEREHDNLRAAMRFYLDQPGGIKAALELSERLGHFWYWRYYHGEGRLWFEQLLAKSETIRTEVRAKALYQAALFAGTLGDIPRAIVLHEANLELSRELDILLLQSHSLAAMGILFCRQGNFPRAIAVLEDGLAIAHRIGAPRTISSALLNFASVLFDEGRDLGRAVTLFEESRLIAHAEGLSTWESLALSAKGMALAFMGDYAGASQALEEGLRMQQGTQATMSIVWSLQYLGMLHLLQAHDQLARDCFVGSLRHVSQSGGANSVPTSLEGLAGIAARQGRQLYAARLLGAAEALRETLGIIVAPIEQPHRDRALATVRAQLAEAALRDAWQAGRKLTLEQAIDEAEAFAHAAISTLADTDVYRV